MFHHHDIRGDLLPPRTLSLTFDDGPGATVRDGPGPRTAEMGRYLQERGIPAAFFVVGRHAKRHPDVLDALLAGGHLLCNHTETHPGLVALAESGGDVVGELARTDELLRRVDGAVVRHVRPPYGSWRRRLPPDGLSEESRSIVAERLNASGAFPGSVGPINWDISGQDYDFWRDDRPASECARRYLERIERTGRGIVLMHDSSPDPRVRAGNRTLDLVQRLIPELQALGYTFVRLDAIPQVRTAACATRLIALRGSNERFISSTGDGALFADAEAIGFREQFGLLPVADARFAIRTHRGWLLRTEPDGLVSAGALTVEAGEPFALDEIDSTSITLRNSGGTFLAYDPRDGGRIVLRPGRDETASFRVVELARTG
jgi:peptidoglycan/xylan/chitin deacetylase (PgdA/CDA1 family)